MNPVCATNVSKVGHAFDHWAIATISRIPILINKKAGKGTQSQSYQVNSAMLLAVEYIPYQSSIKIQKELLSHPDDIPT